MTKYRVGAIFTCDAFYSSEMVIEAESEKDAKRKAQSIHVKDWPKPSYEDSDLDGLFLSEISDVTEEPEEQKP